MSNPVPFPTPYPEINTLLGELLSGVQSVLGDGLVGLYLYGSLASGDFDPQTSDIDFVVVTAGEIPSEMIPALEALHHALWAGGSRWAKKLEGTYLPRPALRSYDPNDIARPSVNQGKFFLSGQGNDWVIQRHILREHGVSLAGPPLQSLIDPVQPDEIRQAVLGFLREWWAPMLQDPARLQSDEYQAYAVLTMCRALYTLEYGTIASKPASARWAKGALGERWASLIDRASTWRQPIVFDIPDETMDFIRFTIERSLKSMVE